MTYHRRNTECVARLTRILYSYSILFVLIDPDTEYRIVSHPQYIYREIDP